MKKEQEEQFSPFNSYEKYTPKLKLPGIIERKQEKKQAVVQKQKISKRDIITIIVIMAVVSITLYFMITSAPAGTNIVSYEKAKAWLVESTKCNPQEVELKIRNFDEIPISEGEWSFALRENEYTIILDEKIGKGDLKTLIFYFEQSNTMREGTNSFRLYSPDMEYYDGGCTI
jgi:hypothetical protein